MAGFHTTHIFQTFKPSQVMRITKALLRPTHAKEEKTKWGERKRGASLIKFWGRKIPLPPLPPLPPLLFPTGQEIRTST